MGLESFQEIMQQYQHAVLPPHHPTSRFVQGVAEQILTATGLGHLKGRKTPAPLDSLFGGDTWKPDETSESLTASPEEEWEVYVIKDDNTRNAFVLPGELIPSGIAL